MSITNIASVRRGPFGRCVDRRICGRFVLALPPDAAAAAQAEPCKPISLYPMLSSQRKLRYQGSLLLSTAVTLWLSHCVRTRTSALHARRLTCSNMCGAEIFIRRRLDLYREQHSCAVDVCVENNLGPIPETEQMCCRPPLRMDVLRPRKTWCQLRVAGVRAEVSRSQWG